VITIQASSKIPRVRVGNRQPGKDKGRNCENNENENSWFHMTFYLRNLPCVSCQFAATQNPRLQFQKRGSLFIRTRNELLSVAAPDAWQYASIEDSMSNVQFSLREARLAHKCCESVC
jgi:hypothetical protein